ncbi:Rossmann-like alpha/beta/alpha sandwich [Corchorus capsularis]|uniref:Rossmann-like alpha/beta/alpha sandwich n=1 Tax=Corchorus capsularis TaxID=210143 RepID=A0A1R3I309_COCAP|nr:Rossmann-like alpha/beta/alpha sandwich [Corchorus capsularis]
MMSTGNWTDPVSEIEEEEEKFSIKFKEEETIESESESSLFSFDVNNMNMTKGNGNAEESVYVAVGKSDSSMDALCWTLSHFFNNNNTSSILYLIHVFPHIRYIPSPLGMLPKSQVSPIQLETYMSQERDKRRQLLQKFIDICSASKVKVETMLIESDMVAKAVLDLIPILNITKLVVGTTNPNPIPRKVKSRKCSGIADEIFQNAPITCEVKVVRGGKELTIGSPSPSPSPSPSLRPNLQHNFKDNSFSCMCFRPKF